MELFGSTSAAPLAPLAERMRPRRLSEIVGHHKLLAADSPFREALRAAVLPSMILWGPPGTGKTTLARALASECAAAFEPFSAVLGGVKEIREVVARAEQRRSLGGRPTILFIDEIHRFNKAQQDALLPHLEAGTIALVGATTENPSFALNDALLSRARVFTLESLLEPDLVVLMQRALGDSERGLGALELEASPEALELLARFADGDARRALGRLEDAAEYARRQSWPRIDRACVETVAGLAPIRYDRAGDGHFDAASAFIKSMRGSDPDAAVYYMARMLEGGEDPRFVARRMVIFAAEDVGNADPGALPLAVAALQAAASLGMPEAAIPLAQVACYLAVTPKSNASYVALREAQAAVRQTGSLPIPPWLVNAPTRLMKEQGRGEGYIYPHDTAHGFVPGVSYLPDALASSRFYRPTSRGREKALGERLDALRGEGGGEKSPACKDVP